MNAAERAMRVALLAYPPEFRDAWGPEMLLVLRDQRRDSDDRPLRFWLALLSDVARTAPTERIRAMRARDTHQGEGPMRPMAMFAVLFGLFEMVSTSMEGWVGGVQNGDAYSMFGGVAGLLAGALLAGSGIALLRQTPHAVTLARRGVAACLILFVSVALAHSRMSGASTVVGIGFPLALLLFLHFRSGRGQEASLAV